MTDYAQPDVANKRVRFFDGQFLQDQDFVDEQKYHLDRERRLAGVLGLQGVVSGLAVAGSARFQVTVAKGVAVDSLGRQLVLAADLTLALPENQFRGTQNVGLFLVHQELPTDVAQTGGESARRWDEGPKVAAVASDGSVAVAPDGALPTWDGPSVQLAKLAVSEAGEVTVDAGAVVRAGVAVPGAVGVGTLTPAAKLQVVGSGGQSVDLLVNGRLCSNNDDGGLWINQDRFVGGYGAGKIGFYNSGWRLNVLANGHVGIGTNAPENSDGWSANVDVLGGGNAKLSLRTAAIDSRVIAQERGWWGSPAGMVVGTQSGHALSFATNAATRLSIDPSGNVGIGTGAAVPRARLDVIGGGGSTIDLLVSGRLKSDNNDGGLWVTDNRFVGGFGADGQGFWNSGEWRLTVHRDGNVAIGTNGGAPENADGWARTLDMLGSGNAKLSVRTASIDARVLAHDSGFFGSAAGMIVGSKTNHPLSFATNGATRMVVAAGGNVGIGTTAPGARLEVVGGGGGTIDLVVNGRLKSNSADGGLWVADKAFVGGTGATGTIGFWIANAWRLQVNPSGNVGIGTDPNNAFQLTVGGGAFYGGKIWANGGLAINWMGQWKNAENTWQGNWGAVDTAAPSDGRLKTAVRPIGDAVAAVARLTGVRFRWGAEGLDYFTRDIPDSISAGPGATDEENRLVWQTEHDKTVRQLEGDNIGLVAQDVEDVLPEVVTEGPDGYKRIRYGHLTALLVEAVKEQQATIAALSSRLDAVAADA